MTPGEFDLLDAEAAQFGIRRPARLHPARHVVPVHDGADFTVVSSITWGEPPPAVVLLHGMGLNAHTWDATAMALGAPAVALDLPGHGDSSWRLDADYRATTIVGTVAVALDTLAPAPAALVGQSLGGLTAILLAATHPERFTSLVVVDITPGLVLDGANQARDFLDGVADFASRDEIVERALAFGFGPDRVAVERGVLHNTRIRPDGRVVFKHHLANLGDREAPTTTDLRPLWEPLERIDVPVTLVRGTRGIVTEAMADELVERVPGARVVTVDAGHNVQEDAPVELARCIAEARR